MTGSALQGSVNSIEFDPPYLNIDDPQRWAALGSAVVDMGNGQYAIDLNQVDANTFLQLPATQQREFWDMLENSSIEATVRTDGLFGDNEDGVRPTDALAIRFWGQMGNDPERGPELLLALIQNHPHAFKEAQHMDGVLYFRYMAALAATTTPPAATLDQRGVDNLLSLLNIMVDVGDHNNGLNNEINFNMLFDNAVEHMRLNGPTSSQLEQYREIAAEYPEALNPANLGKLIGSVFSRQGAIIGTADVLGDLIKDMFSLYVDDRAPDTFGNALVTLTETITANIPEGVDSTEYGYLVGLMSSGMLKFMQEGHENYQDMIDTMRTLADGYYGALGALGPQAGVVASAFGTVLNLALNEFEDADWHSPEFINQWLGNIKLTLLEYGESNGWSPDQIGLAIDGIEAVINANGYGYDLQELPSR